MYTVSDGYFASRPSPPPALAASPTPRFYYFYAHPPPPAARRHLCRPLPRRHEPPPATHIIPKCCYQRPLLPPPLVMCSIIVHRPSTYLDTDCIRTTHLCLTKPLIVAAAVPLTALPWKITKTREAFLRRLLCGRTIL